MEEYALETRFKGSHLKLRGKAFRLKKQDEKNINWHEQPSEWVYILL